MRKHLSIWMLFVRNTLYKVLAVLALMVGVEVVLFQRTLSEYLKMETTSDLPGPYSLSRLVEDAEFARVFVVAFALITLVLCLSGCDFSGKLGYTLQRLRISPMKIFLWQAVHNAMVYVLLWLVQVYTLFGCSLQYIKVALPAWVTNQSLFLEVNRSKFWYGFFPLGNGWIWVMLVLLVIGLGIVTARVPHCQRRRKFPFAVCAYMMLLSLVFAEGTSNVTFMILMTVVGLVISVLTVFLVHVAEPGLDEE